VRECGECTRIFLYWICGELFVLSLFRPVSMTPSLFYEINVVTNRRYKVTLLHCYTVTNCVMAMYIHVSPYGYIPVMYPIC
jgi:hypothetical protein